ncbi:hypothetical protein C3F09_03110, partial [candidate division GN15 bacterium]
MRRVAFLLTAAFILFASPLTIHAQVCGDVNNHPPVDISDWVNLADYLGFGPAPAGLAMADCDGRSGVTICDDAAIANYLFNQGTLNCSPAGVYSSNYTIGDTLYWPYMLNIPDGINAVDLPVTVRLEPNARGYYLPFLNQGSGANGIFQLQTVETYSGSILIYPARVVDTTVLITVAHEDAHYTGVNTLFTLHYVRTSPGTGNIVPELVERSSLRFPSFVRNNDMFRFAVVPTEQFLPPETLKANPVSLAFSSMAGKVAPDSFLVSFSSTGVPINFTLAPSDSWISLLNYPPTGFTTPASVWVKASAATLGIGDYTGHISLTPAEAGTPTAPSEVAVTFHVTPPVVYPPGDFNCDGICD